MSLTVLPVLYTILQIAVPVLLGFFFRRATGLSNESYNVFGKLVVTLTLPLYFFVRVSRIDTTEILRGALFPVAAALIVGFGVAAGWLLAILMYPDRGSDTREEIRYERRLLAALGGFGNSGYLPLSIQELLPLTIPAMASYFGTDLPILFIGAYIFIQSPLLWSVGNYLVTGSIGKMQIRSFISPPIFGIVLGLAASIAGLSGAASDRSSALYYIWYALETVGSLTIPLVLLTLGGLIAGIHIPRGSGRRFRRMAGAVLVVRFLIIPGAFWLLYLTTHRLGFLPPAAILVLFLETHTPTASNFTVMTARVGRNEGEAAFTLMAGYIAYLIVFPIYLTVFLSTMNLL